MLADSDATRLSLALSAARLGDWSWDAATDVVIFSERAAVIFDIPPGPHMTWTAMRELLHPEDRDRARVAVEHAVQTRTDYDIEYRLINGARERWVSAWGRAVYGDHGVVLGMLGVVQDITDEVRTRETLRAQAESLETINRVGSMLAAELDLQASSGGQSYGRPRRQPIGRDPGGANLLSPVKPWRVYGELVSLLAERGDLETAIAIEALGNELARTHRARVLCGYHVHPGLTPASVRRVEQVHDQAVLEATRLTPPRMRAQ